MDLDQHDKNFLLGIGFIFVFVVGFVALGASLGARDNEKYRVKCFAAGGDKVTFGGRYSTPAIACWNTKEGRRIFLSSQRHLTKPQ